MLYKIYMECNYNLYELYDILCQIIYHMVSKSNKKLKNYRSFFGTTLCLLLLKVTSY